MSEPIAAYEVIRTWSLRVVFPTLGTPCEEIYTGRWFVVQRLRSDGNKEGRPCQRGSYPVLREGIYHFFRENEDRMEYMTIPATWVAYKESDERYDYTAKQLETRKKQYPHSTPVENWEGGLLVNI